MTGKIRMEVLKCQHCPKLAITIDDSRITSHKCAGAWTTIHSEYVDPSKIYEAIAAWARECDEQESDEPTEPDTLANLGMCEADFR